jgi:dTDP-4-amino-4,6-dideoxygalactose transaminase
MARDYQSCRAVDPGGGVPRAPRGVLSQPGRERLRWSVPAPLSPIRTPAATIPILDLSREYRAIGPALREAVEAVLSHQQFVLGEEVALFERAAAARCGTAYAVGCASGTDALWLAMAATGIGPGDAVVTTPFSFFATVSSILRAGARPVLADIDPESFNLSPGAVEACLASGSPCPIRAILAVHLFGQTADWDSFTALQEKYRGKASGLVLIEDAAQAFGACWDTRPAGGLGEAAAFSFYPTKNLAAGGDAGMVTTSAEPAAGRLRMLRTHGMRRRYYHEEVGWNSRMDTIQAAMLLVKLRFIDEWNEQRRRLAGEYRRLFERAGVAEPGPYPDHGVVLPKTHAKATHVFNQFTIRVRRRDALKAFLAQNGVASEIYYPLPLHLQPALESLGYGEGSFPESERAAREVLSLPIFPQLTLEEQEVVVARISDFLS